MNIKKLSLFILAALSLAVASTQARKHRHRSHFGFSMGFNAPAQPAMYTAPYYTNVNGYQYYWNGQEWFIWAGNQWLRWDGYGWVPTTYYSYNCFAPRHSHSPSFSFGLGSKHGGVSFSF